ncbi:transposase, Mutator family protein [Mycobacterium xenopi 4042]|uniref:Mutator family transposase n=1 Tax=Mycobacterium xenopi 4042 TaxID=1299334 RepID=X8DKN1_MYCXE|nr:transposase, Mutator family protein [Mycobacterium xenopi 4042]
MTSPHLIDAEQLLADQLAEASPDLLRGLLSVFIHALMGAEADAICGAGYRQRSDERSNSRNGYRHRDFDTRAGTIDVAIPKLRQGSYFPDWLLERRKRAERALTSVVATCYLLGVSTRRMERLVETLGVTRLSKSQVSIMAKELDEQVEAFRTRPLDAGPYTFVAADALVLKVREAGRVVGVHTLIATGVNAEGYREILGVQVSSAEDGAGWLAFFRDLVARGLSGWRWSPATPTPAWSPRSGHLARSGLAALPHPLREQPDGGHPEVLLAVGAHSAALGLRPARRRIGCCPIRSSPRRIVGQAPQSGRTPRRSPPGSVGVHRFSQTDLAPNLEQQSPGTAQQRNQAQDRRRGHLPRPGLDHPPRRCRAGRTTRRMDRRTTLPGP